MSWSSSNRRGRLPSNWPAIRQEVFRRKGRKCLFVEHNGTQCSEPATDIDHIKPGDDNSLENLQPLCSLHHRIKSSHEGWEALRKAKRRARWNAERQFGWAEEHPGHNKHAPYRHPWET